MKRLALALVDSLFLMRLPLLLPVWTILLLGWVTGHPEGGTGWGLGGWSTVPCLRVLLASVFGFSLVVAAIYVVNQIADIESDRINHKLFLLPHGFISVGAAWAISAVCLVGGMAIGVRAGRALTWLFAVSAVLGYLYNLPPVRLKDHALGGTVANCVGHGILTYLVGWCASKCGNCMDGGQLWSGLLSSLSPALANGAVFLATTIPDAAGDRATGKRTFCVRFGTRVTSVAAAVMCLGALLASALVEHHQWVMAVPSGVSLVFFGRLAFSGRAEDAYPAFRWPVLLLSITVMLMVPLYGVLLGMTFLVSRVYYRRRFGFEYPSFTSK